MSYLVSRYKKEVIRFGGVGYIAWYGRAHKYKPTSLKLMSRVGLGGWILDVGVENAVLVFQILLILTGLPILVL